MTFIYQETDTMTLVHMPRLAATLLALSTSCFAASAWPAPELRASATQVSVGDTLQIDASSGSSMLPVYAKDWNVSPQFSLISAGRTGARVKAVAPGFGAVSANVTPRELTIDIKVPAAKPVIAEPASPAPAVIDAAIAPPVAEEAVAPPPSQKLSACQQEIIDRKQEIAQDFNTGNYDAARTKLLDLKQSWQEDGRWADALLGAINMLAPIQPAGR